MTYAKKLCKLRAKIENPGYLPVCRTHSYDSGKMSGRCQAVENCGQLCNRLSSHNPPYHLCYKHQDGSNTLPCHLLRIPTELRLMIFHYLFPTTVTYLPHVPKPRVAILKVNRQLYQEASAVLYEEFVFEALVDYDSVHLRGKQWSRAPSSKREDKDFSIGAMLSQSSAQRIQNLEVHVTLGEHHRRAPASIDSRGVTKEDYHLHATRDCVRKLVALIADREDDSSKNQNALKRLKITAAVHQSSSWKTEETISALFVVIEPFMALRGIESPELKLESVGRYWAISPQTTDRFAETILTKKTFVCFKDNWTKMMQKPGPSIPTAQLKDVAITTAYHKIEAFAQLMQNQESQGERSWPSGVFNDIRRPLHLARVAYEYEDMAALKNIREAIKIRWVNAQRQQQQSLQLMADSIDSMYDDEEDEDDEMVLTNPSHLYPDAFQFGTEELISQKRKPSALWEELDAKDWAPKIGSPGITYSTKGVQVKIEQKNRSLEWIRLRTPAVVRQIRAAQKAEQKTEQT
ncbi:hypothetical protein T440DRAFT_470686 [Plenodomus tracheiphilus IPT5]|uniref:F-box domain-containing protein n=1 Tax=Plenodomus tracheiphilus IPT5 TaxID=1408161 RepID=A0A6A7B0C9_9PLEO|nr:hypothetical protein T440DRAFT_470686 [Plenodomus tracheiphilus IPT5]